MIITCPSCSARYQLADSKVKSKGTKVRCPRCSHKFTVFPEQKSDTGARSTELFVRKQGVIDNEEKDTNKQKRPAAEVKAEVKKPTEDDATPVQRATIPPPEADDPFDQPTRAYTVEDKPQAFGPEPDETAPPVSTRSGVDEFDAAEKAIEDSQSESNEGFDMPSEAGEPIDQAIEEAASVRPFGPETLFEIQQGGKKSRKIPWKPLAAATVFGLLAVGVYFIITNIELDFSLPETGGQAELEFQVPRPKNWYRDDPRIYQQVLASVAAMPDAEKEEPEYQALISEALVLNGLLWGHSPQVNQGLGMTSVAVAYPDMPVSFYANSAWAIWENKLQIQQRLLEKWPKDYHSEPEFRLLKFMTLARTKEIEKALEEAKSVLNDHPGFQRANDYSFLLALKHPREARKVFGPQTLSEIESRFENQRRMLLSQLPKLPRLYEEIDRLRGKPPEANGRPPQANKPEETKPQARAKEPPKEKPAPVKKEPERKPFTKPPAPKIEKSVSASDVQTGGTSRTGLPNPSRQLVAKNSTEQQDAIKAKSLLSQGNKHATNGNDDAALRAYREGLKHDPALAELYKRIGMIYMKNKENQKALKAFRLYLRLKPGSDDQRIVEGWISSLE